MKIEPQQVDITPQLDFSIDGCKKHIENCTRVCYQSYDKKTDDSYLKFYDMLIKRGHLAPLEHATIYLTLDLENYLIAFFKKNVFSKVRKGVEEERNYCYVTTNMRVLVENDILEKCKEYICEPTVNHFQRFTFRIITNRAIQDEIVRHRNLSFCVESTRYVNYKAGLTLVPPFSANDVYIKTMKAIENAYFEMVNSSIAPQFARGILPLDLKTEMYVTGFFLDWKEFVGKRNIKAAHPLICWIAKEIDKQI